MFKSINSLRKHSGFMKYFMNSSWLFLEKILRMIVSLFVGIGVARYLGPEQFGVFNYAQSYVGLFASIATLGLDSIVVREIVKDNSKAIALISSAFWLKLFGSIAVLLILFILSFFTSNKESTNFIIFIIASCTFIQSFNVIEFYFQSKVFNQYIVFANIIALISSSILRIGLILLDAPLTAFAWAMFFDAIVLASSFSYFFKKSEPTFTLKNLIFHKEIASNLLKHCWPMAITISIVMSYLNLNQILIEKFLGTEALSYYSVAYKLAMLADFIPLVIVGTIFPKIVQIKDQAYSEKIQILMNFLFVLSLLYAIFIFIFSEIIVVKLYGSNYMLAVDVLKILSFMSIFSFVGFLSGRLFIIYNLEKLYMFRASIGVFVLYSSSVFLIPRLGLSGAAFSLLISELFVVFISDLFFYKKTKKILLYKIKMFATFWDYRLYSTLFKKD